MRRSSILLASVVTSSLVMAQAASASESTLTLNLPALNYSNVDSKVKPKGGAEAKSKTNNFRTQDLSPAYAMVSFLGKANVYYYPFNDAKQVSASYMVTEMVEVGLDLGYNSMKVDKPKDELSSTNIGLFANFYPNFGAVKGEFGLGFASLTSSGEKVTTTNNVETKTKTDTTGTSIKLVANVLVPVAKNLDYTAGLWFQMDKEEDKENKVDTDKNTFGVNIASLRLTL